METLGFVPGVSVLSIRGGPSGGDPGKSTDLESNGSSEPLYGYFSTSVFSSDALDVHHFVGDVEDLIDDQPGVTSFIGMNHDVHRVGFAFVI